MAVFVQETRVAVWRNNIPVAGLSSVPVRLRYMSPKEVADLGGASPYDSFSLSSMCGQPDIQRRDLLVDLINVDPLTNTNAKYRVFGIPHFLDTSYLRVAVEKVVGN